MNRIWLGLLALAAGWTASAAELPKGPSDLFRLTKLWNARLTFSAEEWAKLQPARAEPGPQDGPAGGRGGFGPGTFLAGGFLAQMDQDKDGGVTQKEFVAGFERWFKNWDASNQGFLTTNEVRDGMNKDLMPQFGGPPGGGGGPGGPGGGGGFGLQGKNGSRNGLSATRGVNFEYVHGNLEFEGLRLPNVAVRYKGNGTFMDASRSDKKSFKVDLNEFVKGQKVSGVSKLNFHNNITDAGYMNEPLAYALYRDAGVPAPRTAYARLTVDAAGAHTNHYLGLYSVVENLDNNWAEDRFGTKKGLILKPVTRELFKYQGDDWNTYKQAYDPKTDPTPAQQQRVFAFARLVTDADDAEFARRLPEFLDIDEFSRFMAVTVWLSSTDSILMMGQNFVVYLHPKTDRFSFVPWDLDRAFGNFFTPSPTELSINAAWGADNRFLQRVMKVDAVKHAYLARMKEFQQTLFRPERLATQVDQVAAAVRSAVQDEDPRKLERFDKVVAGETVPPLGFGGPGGPGGAPRVETPRPGAAPTVIPIGPGGPPGGPQAGGEGRRGPGFPPGQTVKTFVKARYDSVADQLAGKSEGVELSGGFGGPGGPGGRRGPGGPGGPGGMPMMGPGNFIGPVFVKAADRDADGKVTLQEFRGLAEVWFVTWDKSKAGTLKQEDIAAGLNAVVPPPNFGPPGPP